VRSTLRGFRVLLHWLGVMIDVLSHVLQILSSVFDRPYKALRGSAPVCLACCSAVRPDNLLWLLVFEEVVRVDSGAKPIEPRLAEL